jgi:hypothetical protein
MDRLRVPFFLGALACAAIALAIELGSLSLEAFPQLAAFLKVDEPPGFGIPAIALVDIMLVFTLAMMAASLKVPEAIMGRVQGCATVIVSCLVATAAIVTIFLALGLLLLMIGLIASFFGVIVYFAVFANFPRGAAATLLGLLLSLKIATGVLLLLAHQRFVQATGLLLLLITSLVLGIVITFLHDLVPRFLVSITDAVGAIVVGIVAVIWAIVLLIGGVIGVLKIIQAPNIGGEAVTR